MGSSSIQFHAAPEELRELAEWIAEELNPRIVVTMFPPERQIEVTRAELAQSFDDPKLSSIEFVVGRRAVRTGAYDHRDAITMQVAMPKKGELRQSAVGIVSDERTTLEAWKTVSQQVRKRTRAGITATNPATGDSAHYRQFRFTEGARALAQKGVKMLPFAGTAVIEFDEPV